MEFAQCWHSLPVELKISVLEHNLKSTVGIKMWREYHKHEGGRKDRDHWDRRFTLDVALHQHLAMGHDIADLAHSVFYKSNTFIITTTTYGCRTKFGLPPPATRPLMGRLRLEVYLCNRN
jgi:hypothetical protein